MTISINKDTIKALVKNVENSLVKDGVAITSAIENDAKIIKADEEQVAGVIKAEIDKLVKEGQTFVAKVKADEQEVVNSAVKFANSVETSIKAEVVALEKGKVHFTGFGKNAKFFLLPTVAIEAGNISFGWLFLTWAFVF